MEDLGLAARPVVWSDPNVVWSDFDLVVASGAWDNIHHQAAFLAWVDRVGTELGVPMVNSPATLRWNLDKHYLRALADAGVPIVPTTFVEPDAAADLPDLSDVTLPDHEIVVKPAISGGGFRTARYTAGEHDHARAHLAALLGAGRSAMVQPYQHAVDAEGEAGLVFIGGAFSHAIRKEPMIRPGAGPRDSLIANQVVSPCAAVADQVDMAEAALGAAEALVGPSTYARVDMVRGADGRPALLELELLDPVLFMTTAPASAESFARVLADTLRAD
jgi:glutathione synthase/RimK-type ligase-like ATP-grasp enzyme